MNVDPETAKAAVGKTKELGVFGIGIGVIFGALMLYANHISSAKRPIEELSLPLAIPASFIVAGFLTMLLRLKPIIILTTGLAIIGFAADLFLSFNPIKALISGAVVLLVLKTARLALIETELNSSSKEDPKVTHSP